MKLTITDECLVVAEGFKEHGFSLVNIEGGFQLIDDDDVITGMWNSTMMGRDQVLLVVLEVGGGLTVLGQASVTDAGDWFTKMVAQYLLRRSLQTVEEFVQEAGIMSPRPRFGV